MSDVYYAAKPSPEGYPRVGIARGTSDILFGHWWVEPEFGSYLCGRYRIPVVSLSRRRSFTCRFGLRLKGSTLVHLRCWGCRCSSQRIPTCQRRSAGVLRLSRWWRFRFAFPSKLVGCLRPDSQTWRKSSGRKFGWIGGSTGRVTTGCVATGCVATGCVASSATRDAKALGLERSRRPPTNRRRSLHRSLCARSRWR